jgi:hypothetical protein
MTRERMLSHVTSVQRDGFNVPNWELLTAHEHAQLHAAAIKIGLSIFGDAGGFAELADLLLAGEFDADIQKLLDEQKGKEDGCTKGAPAG